MLDKLHGLVGGFNALFVHVVSLDVLQISELMAKFYRQYWSRLSAVYQMSIVIFVDLTQ